MTNSISEVTKTILAKRQEIQQLRQKIDSLQDEIAIMQNFTSNGNCCCCHIREIHCPITQLCSSCFIRFRTFQRNRVKNELEKSRTHITFLAKQDELERRFDVHHDPKMHLQCNCWQNSAENAEILAYYDFFEKELIRVMKEETMNYLILWFLMIMSTQPEWYINKKSIHDSKNYGQFLKVLDMNFS